MDGNTGNFYSGDLAGSTVGYPVKIEEGITQSRDPLTLDLDDEAFIRNANHLVQTSKDFYKNTYDLENRRKRNEKYIFGRQLDDIKLKDYSTKYSDNIIYEAMAYIKPIATSKLPDIVVKPGSDSAASKEVAKNLSKIVTTDIQNRGHKRILSLAFNHRFIYFIGIIKAFWDPQKGKGGDYAFKVIHPDNVVVDHKAMSNDARDMDFIAENIEYTVKEWVMRFPDKKEAFFAELRNTGEFNAFKNETNEAGMNSKVKGWELWFTHYQDDTEGKFERLECVAWYYNKLVFKKMKSPNWDWSGEKQTFTYDQTTGDKKQLTPEDLLSILSQAMGNPQMLGDVQTQQIFHNHMDYPEKPYIFLGYDQWGKQPLDETTALEQVILLQDNLDKRGKQTTEMLDRARGKHIFSGMGGTKKEDLEELDLADPDTDLFVQGKVSDVHAFIAGEQPSAPMIQDKNDMRERIFDKMGIHGPARGETDMGSAATNNQIAREGDFTRSDDLTDDTITYAAEKMANWMMQFIKLRYTQEKMKSLLGEDGQTTFQAISRDMVEDGMEVTIGASGTDKLKAQQNAMDMAKLQLIDPFHFYTDINASDPKGRTKDLIMFMDPNMRSMYLQELGIDMAGMMASGLNAQQPQDPNQPPAQGGGGGQKAMQDIQALMQGQPVQPPQQVDPEYMQVFTQFMHSPQAEQAMQNPQLKQIILQFAQAVSQLAKEMAQGGGQPGGQTPPPANTPPPSNAGGFGQPMTNQGVGPTGQNPSPQNTSRVATGGA